MFSLENRNIRVAISPFCNLNCTYCDGPRSRKPEKPGAMEDFRSKPLNRGVIRTDDFLGIINALHSVGFEGITLTGGEPLLNPDWDRIVTASKALGMARIAVTTNGLLLEQYLKKRPVPEGLTLLTVSLDTPNRARFAAITGKDGLEQTFRGLKAVKAADPNLRTKVNKILLKSDLDSLSNYIAFCAESGVVDEVNLLNLILKDKADRAFFQREFVSAQQALYVLCRDWDYGFSVDAKYEYKAKLPNGLTITVKDTDLTLRNDQCATCPIYCQEGFFTVRVATDGTIMACPDYRCQLPFIDGEKELKNGSLDGKLGILMHHLRTARLERTLGRFFSQQGMKREAKA